MKIPRFNERNQCFAPAKASTAAVATFLILTAAHAQPLNYSFDRSGNLNIGTSLAPSAPRIVGQPQMQVVGLGERASFSVLVLDATGAFYQWYFNSETLLGASGDTLLISNVGTTNEGQYWVVVANGFVSVTSAPAMLLIDSLGGGMPDSWQQAYFGNFDQNPAGDYDGDGVSNLDEFLEGTDPTNPNSFRPRLQAQAGPYGQIVASPSLPSYSLGQYVTLTAVPDPGAGFQSWSGAVTGTKNQISLLMNGHKSVSASFTPSLAPPVFESIGIANASVSLTWSAVLGLSYQLQYTTNLSQAPWVNLGISIKATGPTITTTDAAGTDTARFYRVHLLP